MGKFETAATKAKAKEIRAELMAKAKSLGCKVYVNSEGRTLDVTVEAPTGKYFGGYGAHTLVEQVHPEWDTAEQWREIVDRLEENAPDIVDCDDPECDYCHPMENMNEAE